MNNRELFLLSRNKQLAEKIDLWDASSTTTTTSGYERYGMTLEGGHTYVVVNDSYGGYGGGRDSRDCYWMDKNGTMESGNLSASAGRTQAAVLRPTGELHIWVGATPSEFFHIYRFDS